MKKFNQMSEKQMSKTNGGLLFELIGSLILGALVNATLGVAFGVGLNKNK